ncbi:MAG: MGH1-like glycoside hydrolase domain-containing protein [Chthoniobacterales bacterium]
MKGAPAPPRTAEHARLREDAARTKNWKRWGPYLSERQWATVREDYSAEGNPWAYLPHDHARSRAYRWGEDGLLGITDRECRLCFALALWNGRDPILKERLFGLTGPEGNHGEDVKESYFYLDATPTHSYLKALYKYPQAEFPYTRLVEENRARGLAEREFELADTGVFAENRYFDVFAEYAKSSPNDILIKITVANRGPDAATLHLLPTLWFRNMWSWGDVPEMVTAKPVLRVQAPGVISAQHERMGAFQLACESDAQVLFTENETNTQRLFGAPNPAAHVKDAFHEFVIRGNEAAVNPEQTGTKCALHEVLELAAGETRTLRLRLSANDEAPAQPFDAGFEQIFAQRLQEADAFYQQVASAEPAEIEPHNVIRQAYAGLLWTKQFYYYTIPEWLAGDPSQPTPPAARLDGRNHNWTHVYNRDILSMPDKWEYPWFAAWDLAFHMIPFAKVDPDFAKHQLVLLLREWYMHPNGQIPAYEFAFGDVNPPVHAWAAWRVYKMTGPRGERDRAFLESVFQKLLLNFTWWVNRKDLEGDNLFTGGFLGLDNIGVFDRSKPLPTGGYLQQADGTAWMAFYCLTMLSMALELAQTNRAYEDMASKFFEHFVHISDAMNSLGESGLWDEEDGFYYDELKTPGNREIPLKTRSLVGLIPLLAVEVLENGQLEKLPGFRKRMDWFLSYRKDLAPLVSLGVTGGQDGHRLLAVPTRARLERVLRYLLDEQEFFSPFGVRSLSQIHRENPYIFTVGQEQYRVAYTPGESDSHLFGGNSNWRGPIWFPINYLILEALERYDHFYGDDLQVECPTGSGRRMNLAQVAQELSRRLCSLFLPNEQGERPFAGGDPRFARDPHWRELVLFHEHFHGDNGRGLGASHQTGWNALAAPLMENLLERQRMGGVAPRRGHAETGE